MLKKAIIKVLDDQVLLIRQLDERRYAKPSEPLSNSSIGEHTRHIIEMFHCLLNNHETGIINYDRRERNRRIETDPHYAIENIRHIQANLNKMDKSLTLMQCLGDEEMLIGTNYTRELLYNLEHCIHHQALIKVVLIGMPDIVIPEHFGYAASTVRYREGMGNKLIV